MLTILLCGKMRSGKDTIGSLLNCKLLYYNFRYKALADEVKNITSIWKNIPINDLYSNETKHLHRQHLINVGTIGRLIDPNTWVDILCKNQQNSNIIVTDVRYENEILRFKELNGEDHVISILVKTEEAVRLSRGANKDLLNDNSETGLDHLPDNFFDFVINNNSSYDNLENQITPIIKLVQEKLNV